MDNFFKELRRRNVVRVAGVYAVAGWVLVQIATTLEDSMNLPAWFDGVVVALLLIGLPIALIFAWAFELTPDGVVRTEDVPDGQSVTGETGRKLDYAIIAGIVILVAMILMKDSDQGAMEADSIAGVDAVQKKASTFHRMPRPIFCSRSRSPYCLLKTVARMPMTPFLRLAYTTIC